MKSSYMLLNAILLTMLLCVSPVLGQEAEHDEHGVTAEHETTDEKHAELDTDEKYFVFRIGAGWNFPIGQNYAITPQINLDLVEGKKVWVYGFSFAYAW